MVDFAKGLAALGFEIVSTGGTAQALRAAGLPVTPVDAVTGFPEMMDGRVKTLHPKVHGGILFVRGNPAHEAAARAHGIEPVDVVAVNLYPFVETVRRRLSFEETIEQMDIGGPALVRAAAKNHAHVLVVVRPDRYAETLDRLGRGDCPPAFRRTLAAEAIRHTAAYDAAIAVYLERRGEAFGETQIARAWDKVAALRYGENPHQRGVLYRDPLAPAGSLAGADVLVEGKGLSYCNWLDLDAAWSGVWSLSRPGRATCLVIKHAIPAGAAARPTAAEAFARAWETDPVSAYGSVVAFDAPLAADVLGTLAEAGRYVEAIIAPDYDGAALADLVSKRKNLRVLRCPRPAPAATVLRPISGGLLAQDADKIAWDPERFAVPTRVRVPEALWDDLEFAWRLVALVRSNAITIVRDRAAVGIGSGQVNRVDAVRIAAVRAGARARGAVLASDAFFPFPDGVEEAARAGVAAIIQPGGSVRDAACVAAADAAGIPMVFTGERHFSH